jgi:hypothetical protein
VSGNRSNSVDTTTNVIDTTTSILDTTTNLTDNNNITINSSSDSNNTENDVITPPNTNETVEVQDNEEILSPAHRYLSIYLFYLCIYLTSTIDI